VDNHGQLDGRHTAAGQELSAESEEQHIDVTVLPETQQLDGVTAGVLQERETKNGQLAEVPGNFLATDLRTGVVYYFEEDVDNYKGGKGVSHADFVLTAARGLPRAK
jgi:hypothetical protein